MRYSNYSHLEQFFAAFVTMFVLPHHSPDIHVHLVIDLTREISIIDGVSTVAESTMLQFRRLSISLKYYFKGLGSRGTSKEISKKSG